MHSAVKREIFRGGQSHLGRCDTLDGGVVCEVREHNGSVERAGASEALDKVVRLLEGYTHSRKDNGELLVIAEDFSLARYLRREVCVGQTGCREYRQFLTSDEGIKSVYSGDTGLDELLGIASGCRIHRQAVDIHSLLGDYLWAAVYGSAESVKDAAEHIGRNAELHLPAGEAHLAVGEVDSGGVFKQLNKRVRAVYFEHTAAAGLAVCQLYLAEFVILDSLDLAHEHKRSRNLLNSSVFFRHQYSSLASTTAFISESIAAQTVLYVSSMSFSGTYLKRPMLSLEGIETSFSISAPFLSASREPS